MDIQLHYAEKGSGEPLILLHGNGESGEYFARQTDYFSERYRGGIESIPVGQYEAGQVLGLTKTQTFFKVVLLQVVKRIMAPMSNEVITLVKDTSLANVIAVGELIMSAQNIVKVYAIIWPLFYTAIFYLIFCGVLTLLFNALEKKLNYYRG